MKKLSASLSLCVFLLLSCTSSHVRNTLSNVETFIMERPDSALSVLDSIDRSLLTTKRLKAHHALLHAMALDKNYIDVSDDSIARVAVDYFSKHGPEKYEARSLYYLGLAYYYQGEYNIQYGFLIFLFYVLDKGISKGKGRALRYSVYK